MYLQWRENGAVLIFKCQSGHGHGVCCEFVAMESRDDNFALEARVAASESHDHGYNHDCPEWSLWRVHMGWW